MYLPISSGSVVVTHNAREKINRAVHWVAGKHGPVVALVAGVILGLSAAL
ncbi:MAG: hypothetical protein WB580_17620 [Candidatus Binataceae bacterium]|jgi:hypothetical protein